MPLSLEAKDLNTLKTRVLCGKLLGDKMANLTLSIPEEFKKQMDKFAWLNWSELAREAFAKRMKQLELLEKLEKEFEKSELTDQDCIELGRKLREDIWEKYK